MVAASVSITSTGMAKWANVLHAQHTMKELVQEITKGAVIVIQDSTGIPLTCSVLIALQKTVLAPQTRMATAFARTTTTMTVELQHVLHARLKMKELAQEIAMEAANATTASSGTWTIQYAQNVQEKMHKELVQAMKKGAANATTTSIGMAKWANVLHAQVFTVTEPA